MATYRHRYTKLIITILIICLHLTTSSPVKGKARPVYEVNEQARIDEKKPNSPALPYSNPLAGNSKQNARLHAQNQQAMFHAERVRQHKAQLQRWTKAPLRMDSYMRAYHESQESHQLALEQQQSTLKEKQATVTSTPIKSRTTTANVTPKSRTAHRSRQETLKRGPRVLDNVETVKVKKDAIATEKNRNHRSYGSVQYQQYLDPKKYKTIYLSPGSTYGQGVTVKSNGNVGFAHLDNAKDESHQLYAETVPSKTQYIYPKQYSQMHRYQSAQDIETLNSLLKKTPNDQLSQLNALLNSAKTDTQETTKSELETPIDLYFYLKDPPVQSLSEHYDNTKYAQIPQSYASAYTSDVTENQDYKPISEEVDDIEDPNKNAPKVYGLQPIVVTQQPIMDTTTTKNNNYYKVEVASQTISAGFKPSEEIKPEQDIEDHEEEKSEYQALAIYQDPKATGDLSERYLHHNAQFKGVQHLSEDGTGVSAYGDDNLHYAANYEFGYRVRDHHSGNDYGHQEVKRDGKTNGIYHVLLPDGRMQKVRYSAGPEGFHADISYDHLQYKH